MTFALSCGPKVASRTCTTMRIVPAASSVSVLGVAVASNRWGTSATSHRITWRQASPKIGIDITGPVQFPPPQIAQQRATDRPWPKCCSTSAGAGMPLAMAARASTVAPGLMRARD